MQDRKASIHSIELLAYDLTDQKSPKKAALMNDGHALSVSLCTRSPEPMISVDSGHTRSDFVTALCSL